MDSQRFALCLGCALLPFFASAQSPDSEGDLSEAPGLQEKASPQGPNETPEHDTKAGERESGTRNKEENRIRFRGYVLLEGNAKKLNDRSTVKYEFPNAEAGFFGDYLFQDALQLFTEGRIIYSRSNELTNAVFDQGGIRFRPGENWTIAVGKERNRRSPGLIVSPSDFINSSENLPGMRLSRAGVWLARGSYQDPSQSADVFYLPAFSLDDHGFPNEKVQYHNSAVRYFHQFPIVDVSLSAGRMDEKARLGASLQGFVASSWKVYSEAGFAKEARIGPFVRRNSWSTLAGLGYEGNENFTLHGEYFYQEQGLSKQESDLLTARLKGPQNAGMSNGGVTSKSLPGISAAQLGPFLRQRYVILSFRAPNILNRFNFSETHIRSAEENTFLNFARLDWLASDHQVLGVSVMHFDKSKTSQYAMRPFDWQSVLDWQYNF